MGNDTLSERRGFLTLLATYLVTFVALRFLLSGTVGVDDVEQVLFAQGLYRVYNPSQPPLYTWMLWGLFEVFGPSLAVAVILRAILWGLVFLFLYGSARRLLRDPRLALLAAFSPLLIFSIGWGAHQGFTHTALLSAAVSASFYLMVRLMEDGVTSRSPRLVDYAALGLAMGVGFLAKFSFALFALPLFAACLLQEPTRRHIFTPHILFTMGIIALMIVLPVLWMADAGESVQGVMARTMDSGEGAGGDAGGLMKRLGTVVSAPVLFLSPLWLLCLLFFPQAAYRRDTGARVNTPDIHRLLMHFFLIALLFLLLGIFFAGVGPLKARWMHPVLLLFPLFFFLRVEEVGVRAGQIRNYGWVLLCSVVLVAGFWIAQAQGGFALCKKCRLFEPYPELASAIAAAGFTRGTIVAGDEHIGGNFRVAFPGSRVLTLRYPHFVPSPAQEIPALEVSDLKPGQCLVVWHVTGEGTPQALPPDLVSYLERRLGAFLDGGVGEEKVRLVSGENGAARERTLRLGFLILPQGRGTCA